MHQPRDEDQIGHNEDYNRIAILASSLKRDELLGLDADTILHRLFWEENLRRFDPLLPAANASSEPELAKGSSALAAAAAPRPKPAPTAAPPDDFERRRNQVIYSGYQNNRNPFIDRPELVWSVHRAAAMAAPAWPASTTCVSTRWSCSLITSIP